MSKQKNAINKYILHIQQSTRTQGYIKIYTSLDFFSPYNSRTQSAPHSNISTVSGFKQERCGSITLLLALKVDSKATLLMGMLNTSNAILDKIGYFAEFPFHQAITSNFEVGATICSLKYSSNSDFVGSIIPPLSRIKLS